ncbi:PLP-dependent aminotransferase family protein [Sporomusa acidovorans]|uniref:HTH-type transcriptional regulatory protein GabR n=1 Tax=Sporomusa acidovorans (strain ATCC 49682 / DSM 3132 / Mol) TaxID=1123286 RepID=A0ABZ3JAG5_SPOA4|nr:PLP-dependent aminotransferase family protein [Sporomusa acidovorans]OZC21799.1 HTH-type transcriptional regulatory protein GabR [Sporomusa acidovorans DSM 3132]SDD56594.1 GntR family transcriptional regulator / MocR family aminotransferase [Sporomusa acidovorans]
MLGIELQRQGEVSLSRQIYQCLRKQMTEGHLRSGEVLPSTRELAKQLAVSRNTVYEAYEMLAAEGYTVSRQGSATRVADGLYLGNLPAAGHSVEKMRSVNEYTANFRTGQPDLRRFPRHLWLRLLRKSAEDALYEQWGYTGPDGLKALREEIAAWLFRSRGITVCPQDIFITAGATQALHLLAELLYGRGREILVEDPCHSGMLRVFQGKGFRIRPVMVDRQGLQTKGLTEGNGLCAAYVTPSHQFPLGGILPASRRVELLRYALNNDMYIIEDDYDSEFRYIGPTIAPLYSMAPERVIYVGTFSKILFPALRIGYVILPRQLHLRWRYLRTYADVQNPLFEQAALAEFLRTRRLDRHVRQMRQLYGQRRQALLQSLKELVNKSWYVWGDAAGLHLVLEFPGMNFDQNFVRHCKKQGIYITPVDVHSIQKGAHLNKLLLGYGHLAEAEIKKGILLLNEQLK